MHEVEAGLVRIDLRTLLLDVVAEHFAQRLVQQVGGRVVAHDALAGQHVDLGGDAVADRDGAGLDDAVVAEDGGLDLLRILDGEDAMHRLQHAAIADLAAGLGVERRVVKNDDAHFALVQLVDRSTVLVQGEHVGLGFQCVVAVEGRGRAVVVQIGRHLELAGGARLFLLARHRGIEGGGVNGDLVFAADVLRQVEREAVGVVQLEGGFAIEHAAFAERLEFAVEDGHAVLDGFEEAVFFLFQRGDDLVLVLRQFRVGGAHFGDQVGHHLVEEGGAGAELVAVADGAADDAAQHVAAAFVAGNDAVGNEEGAGADVVGQHLQRRRIHVGIGGFASSRLQ